MLTMPSSPMATNTSGLSTQPCGMPSAPYLGGSAARTAAGNPTASTSPPSAEVWRNFRRLTLAITSEVSGDAGSSVNAWVDIERCVHVVAPFSPAACLMAARMRPYVPQRQMLPVMAASMSASVGLGFCLSSAVAAMICPAWQ